MELIISLIERAQSHYSLVLLIVFLLTFSKSCALISFVIPGTSGLLVLGALASTSIGHFLLMWLSASLGAIGGFWLSWQIGRRYQHHLQRLRWLSAERVLRCQLFLRRHGGWAVFFSRFLSPLRATLPLVTGASGTPLWCFQVANVASGLLWPFILLAPGAFSLSFW
ncbi:TPA: DedA family protein [Klebsiella aerogenes]|uniref:DedA family protein n=1 Tax=Klebsiella aerogenes TaxID=548 RepID=A0AAP9QZR2_KLEAE|nr:DedA family protein [Klebsiella aerogenes]EIV2083560.1 DedA family protein [Klebsiella aerogenes]EIW9211801.1 DedA family protein [Klebsiella aerogenes]EKM7807651.1 DedA family protein [Klebsiella aerogenes]EKU4511587.1 DedA family protein [Klebsiella aerogenes]EKU6672230.1 DedA family protein [Klebsiella aerogenes]